MIDVTTRNQKFGRKMVGEQTFHSCTSRSDVNRAGQLEMTPVTILSATISFHLMLNKESA